jgi:hypothetical protein
MAASSAAASASAAPPAPEPAPTPTVTAQAPPPPAPPAPEPPPRPQPAPPVTPVRHVPVAQATPTPAPAAAGGQGLLSVICLPACDQIYDNGKYLGPSPIFKKAAQVGTHKVKLVLNEPSVIKTISVIVQADQVSMVRESMP